MQQRNKFGKILENPELDENKLFEEFIERVLCCARAVQSLSKRFFSLRYIDFFRTMWYITSGTNKESNSIEQDLKVEKSHYHSQP